MSFGYKCFMPLVAQGLGGLVCLIKEPLTLSIRLVRCLFQESSTLLVESLIFLLEIVAFFFGFGLHGVSFCMLLGNPLLPRINGVENGFIKKALHQPYQDEEVKRLRPDSEPINQHGLFPCRCGDGMIPERIGKDEDH